MRLFSKCKDGGPDSPVTAYFLIECKALFSIALLRFDEGGREQYHTHAFNALTWFICGDMYEQKFGRGGYIYKRNFLPKFTPRTKNHRVRAAETSWCLTLRGPWSKTWTEDDELAGVHTVFTHGRKIVSQKNIIKNFTNN